MKSRKSTKTPKSPKATKRTKPTNPPPPIKTTSGFVSSWDELAQALSIDERSLFNFRKRWALEIKNRGRTLTRADGRHSVTAWRAFADDVGELHGRGVNNPNSDFVEERNLRLRERVLAVEQAEHKLAKQKGEVLPLAEYQNALRITIAAFDAALRQIGGRAAERVVESARVAVTAMLRSRLTEKQFVRLEAHLAQAPIDHASITGILDDEIEVCRRALAEADYLNPPTPAE